MQVRFHALAPDDEFLLADAHSPTARDGLVGGVGSIWSQRGRAAGDGWPADALPPAAPQPEPGAARLVATGRSRSAVAVGIAPLCAATVWVHERRRTSACGHVATRAGRGGLVTGER